MGFHKLKAGLQRPTREEYEEALRRAGNAIKEVQKQSVQEKREVVQRFAEIILMNDEGNCLPPHEIAGRAIEVYNKIEDYL
jgi:hypothetical protein